MSNYFREEYEIATQDYQDDLKALKQADEDLQEAYEWKNKMIEKCNASALRLNKLNKDDENK
jgi:cellobiose-specific phosphotransferase system component IIA